MRCMYGSHVYSWASNGTDGDVPVGTVCHCGEAIYSRNEAPVAPQKRKRVSAGVCRICRKPLDDHEGLRWCGD